MARNIALFISSMNAGGAERVMSLMVNHWSRKKNTTIHLILFTSKQPFYELEENVKLHPFDLTFSSNTSIISKLSHTFRILNGIRKLLKQIAPSILISFMTEINIYAIILSKLTKIPVIISERTSPKQDTLPKLWTILRKALYKKANALTVQTKRTKVLYQEMKISTPKCIEVIENPISNKFLTKNKEFNRIILTIGRLSKEKGQDLLIKALGQIDLGDWKVHIIGDGIARKELEELVQKHNLENQVTFLGRKKNVKKYLEKAAIFILPSRYEGFPNALCEAMVVGCACICFDCDTGPRELIKHNYNGLLVEPEDINELAKAIKRLISEEETIKVFSENAVSVYDKLSLVYIMKKWDNLINRVLN